MGNCFRSFVPHCRRRRLPLVEHVFIYLNASESDGNGNCPCAGPECVPCHAVHSSFHWLNQASQPNKREASERFGCGGGGE